MGVIARASTPYERATGTWLSIDPNQDPATVKSREQTWVDAAAGGDRVAFGAILAAYGIRESDVPAAVSDVTVTDPSRIPVWATSLQDFVEAAESVEADPRTSSAIGVLQRVNLEAASRALAQIDTRPFGVDARASAAFGAQLSQRLANVIAPAVRFESDVARLLRTFVEADRREGWLDRLERMPALGYVIGLTYANWVASVRELFERLATDRDLLRSGLWDGRAPRVLTDIALDLGDIHHSGRSVAVLTFDRSLRVVYKPRDISAAVAFEALLRSINGTGIRLGLRERKLLPRDTYGWEEYVRHRPCAAVSDVVRFYCRLGMLMRLAQLVEGRDLWLDNLVADGEMPVIVDLETILQPRLRPRPALTRTQQRAQDRLEESVVPTGLVASPVIIGPGIAAEDIGAITPLRRFRTPYRPSSTWQNSNYQPFYARRATNALRHLGAIVRGYRLMDLCLREHATSLTASNGPLQAFARIRVRHIRRDTWSCYRILEGSVSPVALASGVTRELALAPLFRAARSDRTSTQEAAILAWSEIEAFRSFDIPFFGSAPDTASLLTIEGHEIAGYFGGSAYRRLLRRAARGDAPTEQTDLLVSCVACGEHGHSTLRVAGRQHGRRGLRGGDWTRAAEAIGDLVVDQAESAPNEISWLGLTYDPYNDLRGLGILSADLLTGTCGLAVLLADLSVVLGERRFEQAARRALAAIAHEPADPSGHDQGGGAFLGTGARIYTLRRCARMLRDIELGEAATALARSIASSPDDHRSLLDVVGGPPGLLLALVGPDEWGYEAPRAVIQDLLRGTPLRVDRSAWPYPRRARYVDQLPDAAGARRLTAGRAMGLGLVLPARLPRSAGTSAGSVAARVAAGTKEPAALAAAWVRRSPSAMSSIALLDGIEISLAAYASTRLERFRSSAHRLGAELIGRRRDTGRWLPDQVAADRHDLSIVSGVAAIAHAFLRIEAGERCPSVRLLA